MCDKHPGKTVVDANGETHCLKCEGLKITASCPRCGHEGAHFLHTAECGGCEKSYMSEHGIEHQGKMQWLVSNRLHIDLDFRLQARNMVFRLNQSDNRLAQRFSNLIIDRFLSL